MIMKLKSQPHVQWSQESVTRSLNSPTQWTIEKRNEINSTSKYPHYTHSFVHPLTYTVQWVVVGDGRNLYSGVLHYSTVQYPTWYPPTGLRTGSVSSYGGWGPSLKKRRSESPAGKRSSNISENHCTGLLLAAHRPDLPSGDRGGVNSNMGRNGFSYLLDRQEREVHCAIFDLPPSLGLRNPPWAASFNPLLSISANA